MHRSRLLYRLPAAVGALSNRVDRAARWVLRPLRLGFLSGALIVGLALVWLTASTIGATMARYDDRPAPRATSLAEISQGTIDTGIWVAFDAVINLDPQQAAVPIYANGAQVDEVLRDYYVVRDPGHPRQAMIVRSRIDAGHAVQRALSADLVTDANLVARVLEPLDAGGSGLEVDATRYLDELPAAASTEAPQLSPSQVLEQDETSVRVVGRVAAHAEVDGSFYYLLADPAGDTALVLRSLHPPDAQPIRADGTLVTDSFNLKNLLATWDPEKRFGELDYSTYRLLALRVAPIFEDPSWIPAVLLGLLAALLLVGALIGYPVFRPQPAVALASHAPPLAAGEEIPVQIVGRVPTPHGSVRLEGARARLEWLPMTEVARTRWRYWGAALGDYRRDIEASMRAAGAGVRQLVVHSPVESVLWAFPAEATDASRADPGELYFGLRRAPGIRLRGPGLDAYLAFASRAQRDRALAEIGRGFGE